MKLSNRIRENRYLRFSDASIGDPKIWMITDNGDYLRAIEQLESDSKMLNDYLNVMASCGDMTVKEARAAITNEIKKLDEVSQGGINWDVIDRE
jgi:hypothetical protein